MLKKEDMKLNELILDIFNLECKLFIKMDSYRLVKQKCYQKCLDSNERQFLNLEIHYVFTRLIKTISDSCPELTEEDIVFCCLSKSGLDGSIICRCMGSISKKTINQRKYRIKQKMKRAGCEELFEFIFSCHLLLTTYHQL